MPGRANTSTSCARNGRRKTPFDYAGKYYQVERGFGDLKPYSPAGIPVYFGGASEAAIPVAGKHARCLCALG